MVNLLKNSLSAIKPLFSPMIPLLISIIPLGLLYLIMDYTPLLEEVYVILEDRLGLLAKIIFYYLWAVLCFLIKLVLLLNRASKSNERYAEFFTWLDNNFKSIILYLFIILLSIGLLYCCGYDSSDSYCYIFETRTAGSVFGVYF